MNTKNMTPEQKIEKAKLWITIADRAILKRMKDRYYTYALDLLKNMPEAHPEKEPLLAEIRFKRNDNKASLIIETCEQARKHRDGAKTPTDYLTAAEAYDTVVDLTHRHQVEEPKLTEERLAQWQEVLTAGADAEACRKQANVIYHRGRRKKILIWMIVIVLAAGIFVGGRTSTVNIALGKAQLSMGMYDGAVKCFTKAYNRHKGEKTKQWYLEGLYEQGMKAYADGDLDAALEELAEPASVGIGDAQETLTAIELAQMISAEPGDQVNYGGCEWAVLAKDGNKVTLFKMTGFSAGAFAEAASQTTWADSSLRAYLNGEFYDTTFNEYEKSHMAACTVTGEDNERFGTDGGDDTTDLVWMLSNSEFEEYFDLIKTTAHCYWLRTPGAYPGSMSYVDVEKNLMDYGYEMTSEAMSVRPVICVETQ